MTARKAPAKATTSTSTKPETKAQEQVKAQSQAKMPPAPASASDLGPVVPADAAITAPKAPPVPGETEEVRAERLQKEADDAKLAAEKREAEEEQARKDQESEDKKANAAAAKSAKAEEKFEEDYPRTAGNEHFTGAVQLSPSGVPLAQVAPVGWTGPVPLQIREDYIDELIELLTELKG